MPEKFTPQADQRMKWPTDDEAIKWAESAKKKARNQGQGGLRADRCQQAKEAIAACIAGGRQRR